MIPVVRGCRSLRVTGGGGRVQLERRSRVALWQVERVGRVPLLRCGSEPIDVAGGGQQLQHALRAGLSDLAGRLAPCVDDQVGAPCGIGYDLVVGGTDRVVEVLQSPRVGGPRGVEVDHRQARGALPAGEADHPAAGRVVAFGVRGRRIQAADEDVLRFRGEQVAQVAFERPAVGRCTAGAPIFGKHCVRWLAGPVDRLA